MSDRTEKFQGEYDMWARRRFLRATSLAATSAIAARSGLAQGSTGLPLGDLHEQVARRVRELRGNKARRLRLLLPEGCEDNVLPILARFEQMTGVEASVEWTAVDEINSVVMLNHMRDVENHDIALPASFGLPDLAKANIILSLQPFVERYEPENFSALELYPVADFIAGRRYGYQTDGDVYVMFYNRAWLEDAGNQARFADRHGFPLATPKTWHELDMQMAFFHEPERERFGGLLFRTPDYLVWEWWLRFHAKGGRPLADTGYPLINNPLGQEALIELISASRYLHPEARTAGLFRNWELFEEGQTYANIGWGGTQKFLNRPQSRMRGQMVFAPTPGEEIDGQITKSRYFNWGWNYCVLANSKQPELAYLFILFASSPEMSRLSVRGQNGYFDPFRAEHYKDPEIREIYSDEFLQVHQESMTSAIPDFYLTGRKDYIAALRANIIQAVNALATPKEALDNAAKAWRLITLENGIDNQRRQWLDLLDNYPLS